MSLASVVAAIAPLHFTGALASGIQRDLGFGDAGLGLMVGIFFFLSAAMAPWGGALTDRIGTRPALRCAAISSAIGAAGIAFIARSYWMLVAVLCAAAVGNAIAQPGNNRFIAEGVPARYRGLALGVKQSAIPTSTTLAGIALPTIASTLGWRWAFAGIALIALIALFGLPDVDHAHRARHAANPDQPKRRFRSSPTLLVLAAGCAAGAAAVSTLGGFTVRTAEDAGLSSWAAGGLQVLGSATLVVSRIGLGALMDAHRLDRFYFSAGLLVFGALGFPVLASGDADWLWLGVLLTFGAGWSWPGIVHLGTVEHHPDDMGAASGVIQSGMFGGSTVGPALFGFVAEHLGFGVAWWLSFGWSVLAAALIIAAAMRARRFGFRGSAPTRNVN